MWVQKYEIILYFRRVPRSFIVNEAFCLNFWTIKIFVLFVFSGIFGIKRIGISALSGHIKGVLFLKFWDPLPAEEGGTGEGGMTRELDDIDGAGMGVGNVQ